MPEQGEARGNPREKQFKHLCTDFGWSSALGDGWAGLSDVTSERPQSKPCCFTTGRDTVDDFPCCRLTGVHHGVCTRGPEVGLHVYYILKRADKACTFTCQLLTIYIHQAVDTSGHSLPLHTILRPQARRQSITPFSLCMHITHQLSQAGHAC